MKLKLRALIVKLFLAVRPSPRAPSCCSSEYAVFCVHCALIGADRAALAPPTIAVCVGESADARTAKLLPKLQSIASKHRADDAAGAADADDVLVYACTSLWLTDSLVQGALLPKQCCCMYSSSLGFPI